MKFGKSIRAEARNNRTLSFINFKYLKRILKKCGAALRARAFDLAKEEDQQFATILESELRRVSDSYWKELQQISNLQGLISSNLPLLDVQPDPDTYTRMGFEQLQAHLQSLGGLDEVPLSDCSIIRSSVKTSAALCEFCINLGKISARCKCLRRCVLWNAVAVVKILKKREKQTTTWLAVTDRCSRCPSQAWSGSHPETAAQVLSRQDWYCCNQLPKIVSIVETTTDELMQRLTSKPINRDQYQCPICLDVIVDPVSLRTCGHRFCWACLCMAYCQKPEGTLERCPCCRSAFPLHPEAFEVDGILSRFLRNFFPEYQSARAKEQKENLRQHLEVMQRQQEQETQSFQQEVDGVVEVQNTDCTSDRGVESILGGDEVCRVNGSTLLAIRPSRLPSSDAATTEMYRCCPDCVVIEEDHGDRPQGTRMVPVVEDFLPATDSGFALLSESISHDGRSTVRPPGEETIENQRKRINENRITDVDEEKRGTLSSSKVSFSQGPVQLFRPVVHRSLTRSVPEWLRGPTTVDYELVGENPSSVKRQQQHPPQHSSSHSHPKKQPHKGQCRHELNVKQGRPSDVDRLAFTSWNSLGIPSERQSAPQPLTDTAAPYTKSFSHSLESNPSSNRLLSSLTTTSAEELRSVSSIPSCVSLVQTRQNKETQINVATECTAAATEGSMTYPHQHVVDAVVTALLSETTPLVSFPVRCPQRGSTIGPFGSADGEQRSRQLGGLKYDTVCEDNPFLDLDAFQLPESAYEKEAVREDDSNAMMDHHNCSSPVASFSHRVSRPRTLWHFSSASFDRLCTTVYSRDALTAMTLHEGSPLSSHHLPAIDGFLPECMRILDLQPPQSHGSPSSDWTLFEEPPEDEEPRRMMLYPDIPLPGYYFEAIDDEDDRIEEEYRIHRSYH